MPLYLKIFESSENVGPEEFERLMPEMMAYLAELKSSGKLKQTGPFGDHSGGADIFEADNLEEAEAISARDPFVVNKLGKVTLKEWSNMFDHL